MILVMMMGQTLDRIYKDHPSQLEPAIEISLFVEEPVVSPTIGRRKSNRSF